MFEPVKDIRCPKCHNTAYILRRKYFRDRKQYHVGAYCSECDTWIKWIPKSMIEEESQNV